MIGLEDVKAIGKILQEAGKIEQYQQILELQQQMLDMQKKINDLTEENHQLKEANKIKESLVPENDLYWLIKDGKKVGPFCTKCWDTDSKLVRMHRYGDSSQICPGCKNIVRQLRGNKNIFEIDFDPHKPFSSV